MSEDGEGLVKVDEGCLYQTDDAGEAMLPVLLREGVSHPITLNKDDLIMDVELIDDSVFFAPSKTRKTTPRSMQRRE